MIVRPEALETVLEPCAALLGAGHAVHLALAGAARSARLTALWQAWPGLSLGHALPRRDVWARLAGRLDPAARRRLPTDPGVRAYLAQLDLDLLLVAAAEPGPLETDYLAAAARLGLPAAVLAETAEAALAQAAPGAQPAPARPGPTPPELWARLAWSELTEAPQAGGPQAADAGAANLRRTLEDAYARRLFPALASATAALAPSGRPLLKGALDERLKRSGLDDEISAEAAMAAAAEGQGPVVLGPWWGDADQELLYWIPFLNWWRRRYQVDKERIVAVSSGGAAAWYQGVLGRYIDLAELYDPAALAELERGRREEMGRRGKRFGGAQADREVLKRLNRRLGFRGLTALPPWAMAVTLDRYWSGQAGPALLAARTRSQPLKLKAKRAGKLFADLPGRYLALGVAGHGDGAQAALEPLALELARDSDVVILAEPEDAGFAEALAARSPQLHPMILEPATAKGVASTLLAAADGFVGPQGWMAYAAAALGRPVICLAGAQSSRELIDQAAAARLLARPPLWLGIDQPEIAAVAGRRLAAAATH